MENNTETIKKYVKILPKGIKDYLVRDTWSQKLLLISQMNKLNPDQTSYLKTEVFLILIGMENVSDLGANIQKNIPGVSYEATVSIVSDIQKNVFFEIRSLLEEKERENNNPQPGVSEENLSKEDVLKDIESPTPIKPLVSNPAGKNIILDAQHNLPAGENKIAISSAAVPSRGPLVGNIKAFYSAAAPLPSIKTMPKPEDLKPKNVPIPTPQVPPQKYGTDPYREAAE